MACSTGVRHGRGGQGRTLASLCGSGRRRRAQHRAEVEARAGRPQLWQPNWTWRRTAGQASERARASARPDGDGGDSMMTDRSKSSSGGESDPILLVTALPRSRPSLLSSPFAHLASQPLHLPLRLCVSLRLLSERSARPNQPPPPASLSKQTPGSATLLRFSCPPGSLSSTI